MTIRPVPECDRQMDDGGAGGGGGWGISPPHPTPGLGLQVNHFLQRNVEDGLGGRELEQGMALVLYYI